MVSHRHDVALNATVGVAVRSVDVPGAFRLIVPGNVRALDPSPAMFEAMLLGWEQQQRSQLLSRNATGVRTVLPSLLMSTGVRDALHGGGLGVPGGSDAG